MIKKFLEDFLRMKPEAEMPQKLSYVFVLSEYIIYFIAALIILYTIIYQTKLIFKFLKKGEKPLSDILKIRLVIARILNLSLTLILAGHIIRLTYHMNIKTFIMLIFIILIRELLRKYLDKEVQNIYKNYNLLLTNERKLNLRKLS